MDDDEPWPNRRPIVLVEDMVSEEADKLTVQWVPNRPPGDEWFEAFSRGANGTVRSLAFVSRDTGDPEIVDGTILWTFLKKEERGALHYVLAATDYPNWQVFPTGFGRSI